MLILQIEKWDLSIKDLIESLAICLGQNYSFFNN